MTREDIFKTVDHTLLAQTATWEEIKEICDDAIKYQTASVCIPASYVKRAKDYVDGKMVICTVIGFPNGYSTTAVKEYETKDAILNGDWGLSAYNRAITGINDMETDISYAGINDDSLYQVFDEWCNTIGTPKRAIIYKDTKNTDKDDTRYEFIELQFEIGDYILPMAVSVSSTNDGYTQTSSVIGSLTQGICKKDHYKSPMSYFDNSQYETETIEF